MIFNQFALLVCCSPVGADGVDASGSAPAVDIDTPMKVADASIRERHRHVFNLRMFPSLFHDGIMKELKDHPDTSPLSAEMSQREWEEAIHIVPLFGPKLLRDATDEQKAFREKLGAKKSKKWASMVELYEVEEYKLPGSDLPKKRLLRIHTRKGSPEENRLVCVPQLDVFDVISENHGIVSHMKQNQTCVKVHEKYYNVTESQVNAFVDSCETCNHANPVMKKQKGAKKPILSENFRDRYQVDLIDMRSSETKDVYDNMMRWILTLKDHSTQLTYLVALPRKKASYVAYELDRIFGLIGYPAIFHTDNGKEFTAKEILVLLKEYSSSIITVTGRPRTPSDQGSVESMNKLVERIIQDLENEERLKGKQPNWTGLLGRAMQTINSKCGRGKYDVQPYMAVFGQNYHQQISCSISDMRTCNTIEERLNLSADDRLRNVADGLCVMGDNTSFEPPKDAYWEDDNGNQDTSAPTSAAAVPSPSEDLRHVAKEKGTVATPTAPTPTVAAGTISSPTPTQTLTKNNKVVTRAKLTTYEFIFPTLECGCCLLGSSLLSVGDESYLNDCMTTNRWYESDLLSSFGAILGHQHHSVGGSITMQFITCSYPNEYYLLAYSHTNFDEE